MMNFRVVQSDFPLTSSRKKICSLIQRNTVRWREFAGLLATKIRYLSEFARMNTEQLTLYAVVTVVYSLD
jgi:hypothetical protein